MFGHNKLMSFAFAGVMLVASLTAVRACAQSAPTSNPAPAPPANPSPPIIQYHYHFHQHNYPPMSSSMYPSYNANPTTTGATNMSYPMLPYAGGPAAGPAVSARLPSGALCTDGFSERGP